jgi:TonB family protein
MNQLNNWNDLVFEHRRKDYGAYVLRSFQPLYLTISSSIAILLLLTATIVARFFMENQNSLKGNVITVIDYIELKRVPAVNKIKTAKMPVSQRAAPKVVKEEVYSEEATPLKPKDDQKIMPSFPGGMEALYEWLNENLEYPPMAKRMGLEGMVVVEFTVDKDGRISNVRIKESANRMFNDEALRVVLSMPDWTPGELAGAKVTQTYILPINFVLS